MGLGVVTGSLSIVRTVLNWQNETDDPSWDSIPNWYWRTWEVFFGLAAACIPTLRPGYKWLASKLRARFTKIDSNPAVGNPWTPPKPAALLKSSKKKTTDVSTLGTHEVFLPLQVFRPSIRAEMEHYPSGVQEQEYERGDRFSEGKEELHLPGDMSTHQFGHRPGFFKRLDSEAKVGGGHRAEEVENRI